MGAFDDYVAKRTTLPKRDYNTPTLEEYAAARKEYGPEHELNRANKAVTATGKALMDVVNGVRQAGMAPVGALGIPLPPEGAAAADAELQRFTQRVNNDLEHYKRLQATDPLMTGAGELLGDLAAAPGFPGAGAAKGVAGLARAAAGAGAQATLDYNEDPSKRLQSGLEGAAVGAAGHSVFSALGKTINAIRGRFREGKLQAVNETAAANGIPLTQGDVTGSKYLEALDTLMERIPVVGLGGLRKKQAEKATQMLQRLREDYSRYLGDEPADAARDALFSKMNRAKAQVAKLYDEAQMLAGDSPLLANNLSKVAADIRAQLQKNVPDPKLWNPAVANLIDKFTGMPVLTLAGARSIRSDLKREVREAFRGKLIGDEEARTLNRLVSGIEDDISAFATKKGGMLGAKLKNADTAYRNQVVPFKDKLLAKSLSDDAFDLELPRLLKNPKAARAFYEAADERGKKALQFAMLDNALKASIKEVGGKDIVNPAMFVRAMNQQKGVFGEVFKGEAEKTMRGAINVLKKLGGVNRVLNTPPTGFGAMQNLTTAGAGAAAAAAGMTGGAGAVATGLGALTMLRAAFASSSGRRILQAASDFKGDGKAWNTIFQALKTTAERGPETNE